MTQCLCRCSKARRTWPTNSVELVIKDVQTTSSEMLGHPQKQTVVPTRKPRVNLPIIYVPHTAAHVLTCQEVDCKMVARCCHVPPLCDVTTLPPSSQYFLVRHGRERPYLGSVKRGHIRAPVAVLPPVPEQIATVHEVECVVKEPIKQIQAM